VLSARLRTISSEDDALFPQCYDDDDALSPPSVRHSKAKRHSLRVHEPVSLRVHEPESSSKIREPNDETRPFDRSLTDPLDLPDPFLKPKPTPVVLMKVPGSPATDTSSPRVRGTDTSRSHSTVTLRPVNAVDDERPMLSPSVLLSKRPKPSYDDSVDSKPTTAFETQFRALLAGYDSCSVDVGSSRKQISVWITRISWTVNATQSFEVGKGIDRWTSREDAFRKGLQCVRNFS
jgi:hypothetical protein